MGFKAIFQNQPILLTQIRDSAIIIGMKTDTFKKTRTMFLYSGLDYKESFILTTLVSYGLCKHAGCHLTINSLCDIMDMSAPTVRRLLDSLEAKKHISHYTISANRVQRRDCDDKSPQICYKANLMPKVAFKFNLYLVPSLDMFACVVLSFLKHHANNKNTCNVSYVKHKLTKHGVCLRTVERAINKIGAHNLISIRVDRKFSLTDDRFYGATTLAKIRPLPKGVSLHTKKRFKQQNSLSLYTKKAMNSYIVACYFSRISVERQQEKFVPTNYSSTPKVEEEGIRKERGIECKNIESKKDENTFIFFLRERLNIKESALKKDKSVVSACIPTVSQASSRKIVRRKKVSQVSDSKKWIRLKRAILKNIRLNCLQLADRWYRKALRKTFKNRRKVPLCVIPEAGTRYLEPRIFTNPNYDISDYAQRLRDLDCYVIQKNNLYFRCSVDEHPLITDMHAKKGLAQAFFYLLKFCPITSNKFKIIKNIDHNIMNNIPFRYTSVDFRFESLNIKKSEIRKGIFVSMINAFHRYGLLDLLEYINECDVSQDIFSFDIFFKEASMINCDAHRFKDQIYNMLCLYKTFCFFNTEDAYRLVKHMLNVQNNTDDLFIAFRTIFGLSYSYTQE